MSLGNLMGSCPTALSSTLERSTLLRLATSLVCSLHSLESDAFVAYLTSRLATRTSAVASQQSPAQPAGAASSRAVAGSALGSHAIDGGSLPAPQLVGGSSMPASAASGSIGLGTRLSGGSSCTTSGPLPDSMANWEVQWSELQLIRAVGRGSFGRVFVARWHETEVGATGLGGWGATVLYLWCLPQWGTSRRHAVGSMLGRQVHVGEVRLLAFLIRLVPQVAVKILVSADADAENASLELPPATMRQLLKASGAGGCMLSCLAQGSRTLRWALLQMQALPHCWSGPLWRIWYCI